MIADAAAPSPEGIADLEVGVAVVRILDLRALAEERIWSVLASTSAAIVLPVPDGPANSTEIPLSFHAFAVPHE